MTMTKVQSNYLWEFNNEIESLIKNDIIKTSDLEEYDSLFRDVMDILRRQQEGKSIDILIEKYEILKEKLSSFLKNSTRIGEKFTCLRNDVEKFNKDLFLTDKFIDVDVCESLDFLCRLIEIELSNGGKDFIVQENKFLSIFEKKLSECQDYVKYVSNETYINKELHHEIFECKKTVDLEYKAIIKSGYIEENETLTNGLLKIKNDFENLEDHVIEHNNFVKALTKIKEANKTLCHSNSEGDILNLRNIMQSIKLLLQTMRDSNYRIQLRKWLDNSLQIWSKHLKSISHNETRDMYYGEVEFRIQQVIEEQEKFKNVPCYGLNEAEMLLEKVKCHEDEIAKLTYDIDRYGNMIFFEGYPIFEIGKENLNILRNNIKHIKDTLEDEIDVEKKFTIRFANIIKDWNNVIYFDKTNTDLDTLKEWKRNGKNFLNEWFLFRLEYKSRSKSFIVADALLDNLLSKEDDCVVDEYKICYKNVIKNVMDKSFRFSLTGKQIDDILAIKDLDNTIEELEESVYEWNDINDVVMNDIDKLVNKLHSLKIGGDKDKHEDKLPPEMASKIVEDHEKDETIDSDISIDKKLTLDDTLEPLYINSKNISLKKKNIWFSCIEISIFILFLLPIVGVFTMVFYYGREEILPCHFREFWWLHIKRNGKTPF